MDLSYLVTPFLAWFVAGSLKFAINSLRARTWAFGEIGYGGLPSNHSAIVSSVAGLIALREGLAHPAFGVAVALAFVVILDAASLRKQVGRQAGVINRLTGDSTEGPRLRERMGHSRVEILAGVGVGIVVAFVVFRIGGTALSG